MTEGQNIPPNNDPNAQNDQSPSPMDEINAEDFEDFDKSNPADYISKGYSQQIGRGIGFAIIESIKRSVLWSVLGLLPGSRHRRRTTHRKVMRGQRVSMMELIFGPRPLMRLGCGIVGLVIALGLALYINSLGLPISLTSFF